MAQNGDGTSKAIATITTILVILGGMGALYRMQQFQLDTINQRIERDEMKDKELVASIDTKLKLMDDRTQSRFEKLEEWQRWWYRECWMEESVCPQCAKKMENVK